MEKHIQEEMISKILSNFDFIKVSKVMKFLNWTWANPDGSLAVPSVYELIKHAEELLRGVAEGKDGELTTCFGGGFNAEKESDGTLHLRFCITEYEAYVPGSDREMIENA